MAKGESDEEFLSLEDEVEVITKKSFNLKTILPKSKTKPEPETVIVEKPAIEAVPAAEIVASHAGVHVMRWPLAGMDCPDCAMKAEKAVNRLKQVKSCNVSAIDGTVEVEVDFEKGPLVNVGNVLKSLGNPAALPYVELLGVRASILAKRHYMEVKNMTLQSLQF